MNSVEFLELIRSKTKKPFVFISYSSSIHIIKNRVLTLGKFLEEMDVNVVYDMGGMPPGTDLDEFMKKIADNNCKYVLMVCDHTYKEKTKENYSGVRSEYKYLLNKINSSNDRELELSKVFILLAEEVNNKSDIIPMDFDRRIYREFYDDTVTTFNSILELVKECKNFEAKKYSDKELKEKSENKYIIANNSYDMAQYKAAFENINYVLSIYKDVKKKEKKQLIKYYNLASAINIKLCKKEEARKICFSTESLLKSLKKDNDLLYAICYGNLSMTFVDIDNSLYEEYAKKALDFAKKANLEEMDYYLTLYAASLFKTQRYEEAYSCQKEALEQLLKKKNIKSIIGLQVYANLAEICIIRAEQSKKHNKINLLHESENYIIQALNICKEVNVNRDEIFYELYSISEKVYKSLKNYYT